MDKNRKRLLELLKERSFKYGEVTLSSGRKSDYYLDCRVTTLHPEGAELTAQIFIGMIRDLKERVDAIGGPTLGADPIVGSVIALAHQQGINLNGFIVRSEAKGHGGRHLIEGNMEPGWNVVIVDDVVTTGGSLLKSVKAVEEAGGRVAAVFALVDRGEGGGEALRGEGYKFISLFRKEDFIPAT